MRVLSDVLFWIGSGFLLVSIVLFEAGTRHMRRNENLKRKKIDRVAWKFLAAAGIFYGLAFLTSL